MLGWLHIRPRGVDKNHPSLTPDPQASFPLLVSDMDSVSTCTYNSNQDIRSEEANAPEWL